MVKQKKFIFVIFTISLILRVMYVVFFHQVEIKGDASSYDIIGLNISKGNGFSSIPNIPTSARAPVYPFFLSIIYSLWGHSYSVVRMLQAIISAFTVVLLYFTAKNIFSEKIARISGWILSFYPVLIVYTGLLLSETIFTFLLLLSILFLVNGFNYAKNRYFLLSGFILGLATLTRPVTLFIPLIILILVIIKYKKYILNWVLFFIAFCVTLLPWSFRNYQNFGIIAPCSVGSGFGIFITGYMAEGCTWSEGLEKFLELEKEFPNSKKYVRGEARIELEKKAQKVGLKMINKNLKNYILLVIKRFPGFWLTSHSSVFGVDKSISEYLRDKNYLHLSVRFGFLFLHAIFLGLALFGMILSYKNGPNTLILILLLIYFSGHILFDPCPRFHLPVIPYIFIFVAVSMVKLFDI